MILRRDDETVLDALARTGRESSVSPLTSPETAHLYELVGALADEVIKLRREIKAALEDRGSRLPTRYR